MSDYWFLEAALYAALAWMFFLCIVGLVYGIRNPPKF